MEVVQIHTIGSKKSTNNIAKHGLLYNNIHPMNNNSLFNYKGVDNFKVSNKLNAKNVIITGDLSVGGDTNISGGGFDGNLDGILSVSGNSYFNGDNNVFLNNVSTLSNVVAVTDAIIGNDLSVGNSIVGDNLNLQFDANMRDLEARNINLSQDLSVHQNIYTARNITIGTDALVGHDLSVNGNSKINGSLSIGGSQLVNFTLSVGGRSYLEDDVSCGFGLSATEGTTNLRNVNLSSYLSVGGVIHCDVPVQSHQVFVPMKFNSVTDAIASNSSFYCMNFTGASDSNTVTIGDSIELSTVSGSTATAVDLSKYIGTTGAVSVKYGGLYTTDATSILCNKSGFYEFSHKESERYIVDDDTMAKYWGIFEVQDSDTSVLRVLNVEFNWDAVSTNAETTRTTDKFYVNMRAGYHYIVAISKCY